MPYFAEIYNKDGGNSLCLDIWRLVFFTLSGSCVVWLALVPLKHITAKALAMPVKLSHWCDDFKVIAFPVAEVNPFYTYVQASTYFSGPQLGAPWRMVEALWLV